MAETHLLSPMYLAKCSTCIILFGITVDRQKKKIMKPSMVTQWAIYPQKLEGIIKIGIDGRQFGKMVRKFEGVSLFLSIN